MPLRATIGGFSLLPARIPPRLAYARRNILRFIVEYRELAVIRRNLSRHARSNIDKYIRLGTEDNYWDYLSWASARLRGV
jgi:hypothetical protein